MLGSSLHATWTAFTCKAQSRTYGKVACIVGSSLGVEKNWATGPMPTLKESGSLEK